MPQNRENYPDSLHRHGEFAVSLYDNGSLHFSYRVTQSKIDLKTLTITFWGETLFLVIALEANF